VEADPRGAASRETEVLQAVFSSLGAAAGASPTEAEPAFAAAAVRFPRFDVGSADFSVAVGAPVVKSGAAGAVPGRLCCAVAGCFRVDFLAIGFPSKMNYLATTLSEQKHLQGENRIAKTFRRSFGSHVAVANSGRVAPGSALEPPAGTDPFHPCP
jgi:hypothetical protein